jgi:hypothetical protein
MMSPLELTLLGIAGAGLFGYLFLKAQWARDRGSKEMEDTSDRTDAVAQEYVRLFRSHQSSNLPGMLRANVLSLRSGEEVQATCQAIVQNGVSHPIPQVYLDLLQGVDLLQFFQVLSERPEDMNYSSRVKGIIEELKKAGG